MRRFFVEHIEHDTIILTEEESKHVIRVLRMNIGDNIELVDGKGTLVKAQITSDYSKKCSVQVIERSKMKDDPYSIHIAIAPTKNLDRMEWMVEKCTELGVHKISFLSCDNNERKVLKLERLQKIAVAAMKQSKRYFLPEIEELIDFDSFLSNHPKGYLAHCYDGKKESLFSVYSADKRPILIGPEGDFSEKEVAKAINSGYISITLGNTRLRTETAGLYACSIAKLKMEES